jgi:hypothetical protein
VPEKAAMKLLEVTWSRRFTGPQLFVVKNGLRGYSSLVV